MRISISAAGVLLSIIAEIACGESLPAAQAQSMDRNWKFIDRYCDECHNITDSNGNLAFDTLHLDAVGADAEVWEKAIRKLRGRLMPPPGKPQPKVSERQAFVNAMEEQLDRAAHLEPHSGSVVLHRLNGTEYANAIHEILGLEVDPAELLPRDDKAAGFDNVADVLKVSPSFLEQYLSAARQLSVQAIGNPKARLQSTIYPGTPQASQYMHIEGLPLGTRGGLILEHDFPADGEYEISINGLVGAVFVWGVVDRNTLIVTLDDEKVFEASMGGDADLDAVDIKQAPAVAEINGRFRNIRRQITAGRHTNRCHVSCEDRSRIQRAPAFLRAGDRHVRASARQLGRAEDRQRRDPRAAARDRRERHAESPQSLHLPSDDRRRGTPVRAADPRQRRRPGFPSPTDR